MREDRSASTAAPGDRRADGRRRRSWRSPPAAMTATTRVRTTTPVAALESGTWALGAIQTKGEARVVPRRQSASTPTFSDRPSLAAPAPVNTYSGPYTADSDGALKIGPLASTSKAGPAAFMAVERLYFEALARTATFSIVGDQLTLADSAGGPSAGLHSRNAPPLFGPELEGDRLQQRRPGGRQPRSPAVASA